MSEHGSQYADDVQQMNRFAAEDREKKRVGAADEVQRQILAELKLVNANLEIIIRQFRVS